MYSTLLATVGPAGPAGTTGFVRVILAASTAMSLGTTHKGSRPRWTYHCETRPNELEATELCFCFFFGLLLVALSFFFWLLLVALGSGVRIGVTDGHEKLGDKPVWATGCNGGLEDVLGLWVDVVTIEGIC